MRFLCKTGFIGASFALMASPASGLAATANVLVGSGGLRFVPAVTNINVGDQVTWTWSASGHSSTSGTVSGGAGQPNGLWDSQVQSTPFSFSHTFSSAGTFPYFCTPHAGLGMTGAVVVAVVSSPPSVAITNPASGSVFAAPANVTIQASASGNGGTLTNVQFLANSTVLGDVTAAPYSVVASSLTAGDYTLTAIAANSTGLTATSSVPVSVVNPTPIVLSAPAMQPAANFQFGFTANTGLRYVVQRATNLASGNWLPLATNTAGSSSMTFTDVNATFNPGFYRVGLLPNP